MRSCGARAQLPGAETLWAEAQSCHVQPMVTGTWSSWRCPCRSSFAPSCHRAAIEISCSKFSANAKGTEMVLENSIMQELIFLRVMILQTRIRPTHKKQAMQHMHYISRNDAKQLRSDWIYACAMQRVCNRAHLSHKPRFRSAHKSKLNEQNWFSPSCA